MNDFQISSSKARFWGLSFALTMGLTLAAGFLPSLHTLFLLLKPFLLPASEATLKFLEMVLFPLAAWCFFISIPKEIRTSPKSNQGKPASQLFPMSLFPTGIALVFGLIRRFVFGELSHSPVLDFLWFVFFIPLGEEYLFRGWLYSISQRLFRNSFFTMTNPLPLSLWVTSLAFSLWHLQNSGSSSVGFVLFQLLYTFFTGLWLGYLRWKSGKITIPILAHLALNLAASAPQLLCYN